MYNDINNKTKKKTILCFFGHSLQAVHSGIFISFFTTVMQLLLFASGLCTLHNEFLDTFP